MIEQHVNESAVTTGSSTHNKRIERLWRDVTRCVSVLFADTFRKLEDEGNLDCLNETDMYCLHYVFKPRINSHWESFIESRNNHSLSTEANQTPNQLFICGALESGTFPQQPQASHASNSFQPSPRDHVQVPRLRFHPCGTLCTQISTVDPLGPTDNFGCDIYSRAVNIVGQHLHHGCNDCDN